MTRSCRWATAILAAVAFTSLEAAAAPYRIGVITEAWAANHPAVEGLKNGLQELGLLEGRDVVYSVHFTRGKPEAATVAAAALLKSGVDLIFTSGEAATLAAKQAAKNVPIVFTLVGDPVAVGMVGSLVHPGGNLTGVSSRASELAPKRLEILKTLASNLRQVWFIYYSGDVTDSAARTSLQDAAAKLGLELSVRAVSDAAQLASALKEVKSGDGLFAPTSDTLDIPVAIHEAALASRLPAVFPSAIWAGYGAVVSYGPDFRAQGVQAARLVVKIMAGAKPSDIPVEGAEHIHLALNLKTAGLLGLAVPRKLIFRANAVYR